MKKKSEKHCSRLGVNKPVKSQIVNILHSEGYPVGHSATVTWQATDDM